jgi:hypothetical protein
MFRSPTFARPRGRPDHAALRQAASGKAQEHAAPIRKTVEPAEGLLTASAKATASLAEALRAKAEPAHRFHAAAAHSSTRSSGQQLMILDAGIPARRACATAVSE